MNEINQAEIFVQKLVQKESFRGIEDKKFATLDLFTDQDGIIRLKTRISTREDDEHFRFPALLPAKHPIVKKLIFDTHLKNCHVGTQGLICILRENFWILGGRRGIKSVITRCIVCKRYNGKSFSSSVPPLPLDRVRDAALFEVTGVDFAGPLHLKGGEKAWVCLFTCAVYRAVHLELCTSLSVINFMQALRRFISRRGRPKTVYSDNGTNFVGTNNAFEKLDWDKIINASSVERITRRFNPPTASWWGGFWERLIGVTKQLLRKTLGRACLNYEELMTILCDCEMVINSRPLTYVPADSAELEPLSPMLFLHERPDIDSETLCRRVAHLKRLREELRRRFRVEYLGQLKSFQNGKPRREIKLGEIVLIGNDGQKRLDWPLGRVSELIMGKDNKVRLVKLITSKGILLRPIQRLYALECAAVSEEFAPVKIPNIPANNVPMKLLSEIPEDKDLNEDSIDRQDTNSASRDNSVSESGSAGVQTKSRVTAPSNSVGASRVTRSGRHTKKPTRFLEQCD